MSEFRGTGRTGLYLMVIVILINTCGTPTEEDIRKIVREECAVAVGKQEETR